MDKLERKNKKIFTVENITLKSIFNKSEYTRTQ